MKSAKEFWKEKFEEYPQTDSEKLSVVMMASYGEELKNNVDNDLKKLKGEIFEKISKIISLCKLEGQSKNGDVVHQTLNDVSDMCRV